MLYVNGLSLGNVLPWGFEDEASGYVTSRVNESMDQPKANQRADLLYLLQEFSRVAEVRVCGRCGIRGFG